MTAGPALAGPAPPPLVIQGYAALFERPDLSGDIIEPGAFNASLMRRGVGAIRMLWHHDPARPVGRWTLIREDRRGLYAEGVIACRARAGEEAAALVAAGALDGLSIGFRTRLARRANPPHRRRLVTIDLWEISLVSFPMQEGARLSAPGNDGPSSMLPPRRMGGGPIHPGSH
ncbi:HK97 family phage prohead protease [Fulvimarina sp. 2208YS6-2-32]|uniref:HK97 family phage prohead protease n=1 Tax=Fulvimarina uroteuthidis TaxID=3098149 RepID=A0ABU5I153_9HYPH|nr:HK97 family phage prohead protease [Fulvimarina sp. 2208YS6-2-32]MDY8109108.1 HK97 family phage prohead protease [Fulvimarina sp. 2208YS6-2-32]